MSMRSRTNTSLLTRAGMLLGVFALAASAWASSGGPVSERAQVQEQTRTQAETRTTDQAQEQLRVRTRDGTCTLEVTAVRVDAQGTHLELRIQDRLRDGSCQDVTAEMLDTLAASGDLDRLRDQVQDRLRDGSCQLVDPEACQGPYDYDYGHLYLYLAPGPHGQAGTD